MPNKAYIFLWVFLGGFAFAKMPAYQLSAQTPAITADEVIEPQGEAYEPLRPAKAAFYSAVLPGLGQAFNQDYWKVPIVYGALGTSVYFAIDNHNEFQRYRTAFKQRLAGRPDEFTLIDALTGEETEVFSDDGLIDAQEFFRRRKELSILISAGIYLLQMIEANVDAHLSQYDVTDDLSFAPDLQPDDLGMAMSYGFKLTYHLD